MALVINNSSKLSPILSKSMPILYRSGVRMYGEYGSVWLMIGAKWRKFINGSERVLPKPNPTQPDSILERMYVEDPSSVPYERRYLAKREYMKRESHDRLIEHNKKIRKLRAKITGGVYDNWDYANRW